MNTSVEGAGPAKAGPGSLIVAGVLLAGGVVFLAMAITTAMQAGVTLGGPTLAPIVVTGLWVVAALGYAMEQLRQRVPTPGTMNWRPPLLLLVTVVGYAVVLKYTVIGYVLSTAIFVLIAARLLSTRPWREVIVRDLLVAVGLSLGIYLAFTRLLGIVLPAGVLPL